MGSNHIKILALLAVEKRYEFWAIVHNLYQMSDSKMIFQFSHSKRSLMIWLNHHTLMNLLYGYYWSFLKRWIHLSWLQKQQTSDWNKNQILIIRLIVQIEPPIMIIFAPISATNSYKIRWNWIGIELIKWQKWHNNFVDIFVGLPNVEIFYGFSMGLTVQL